MEDEAQRIASKYLYDPEVSRDHIVSTKDATVSEK